MSRVKKKNTPRAASRATRARVTGRGRAAAARTKFPAIEAFTAGYLNQDVHPIYGGPLGAADAFRADASPAELRALLDEWTAFRAALPRGASVDRLARFQHAFGAGWAPSRFSQVAAVFARLAAPSKE
jgi:contact-dependent growth inhibition (CDI) system CdiI-like immunity protein